MKSCPGAHCTVAFPTRHLIPCFPPRSDVFNLLMALCIRRTVSSTNAFSSWNIFSAQCLVQYDQHRRSSANTLVHYHQSSLAEINTLCIPYSDDAFARVSNLLPLVCMLFEFGDFANFHMSYLACSLAYLRKCQFLESTYIPELSKIDKCSELS